MILLVNLLIVILLAGFRCSGIEHENFTVTNPVFKDFAHLYTGFLFGAWRYSDNPQFFKWCFWTLRVVELGSFVFSKFIR